MKKTNKKNKLALISDDGSKKCRIYYVRFPAIYIVLIKT